MNAELKAKLVKFDSLANTVNRLKEITEKIAIMVEEKVVAPLFEEVASEGVTSGATLKKATKVSRFVGTVSNILYKLAKITVLLEDRWVPYVPPKIPSEEYMLNYIRYMHKTGKLDFTV